MRAWPPKTEFVGQVARERSNSANPDLGYDEMVERVLERAKQRAAVLNNWGDQ